MTSGPIDGRPLVAGHATGRVLVLAEPLSFWGGLDPADGRIIDHRHPQHGESVTGRILALPAGRGSSSSSTVLAEALRLGTAPAAILLARADPIIVMGVLVADQLYGCGIPVIEIGEAALAALRDGQLLSIGDPRAVSPPDHAS